MSDPEARDFTPWSIATYAKEGVETIALELQDKCDFNVNIALWACWCAIHFEPVDEIVFRKAIDLTARWNRDVTSALRGARRAVKAAGDDTDLYEEIKAAELSAEFAEHGFLVSLCESTLTTSVSAHDRRRRAAINLTTYASLIGAPRKPGFSTHLLETLIERIYEVDEITGADGDP